MWQWLCGLFGKVEKVDKMPNITDPYRVNRIIRSKYLTGDYVLVHPVLHHYAFEIDGRRHVFGILEVLSAIKALDEVNK